MSLDNISHIYKGLLLRNRAFASFKTDELDSIYRDMIKCDIPNDLEILDPMSGYGGGMTYFGDKGFNTCNIELNPPSYYWQLLINPNNRAINLSIIDKLLTNTKWPKIIEKYSITDELFSESAILHIKNLFQIIYRVTNNLETSQAILLPFVARFANYQRNDTSFTHFKQGGICSFVGWENEFLEYLFFLQDKISNLKDTGQKHTNILANFLDFQTVKRFKCFVTSPPYPNYRDYSKIFKIENWVLKNVLNEDQSSLNYMIGSDIVKGKNYEELKSEVARRFLLKLLDKSQKLPRKSRKDIEVYYFPYFSLYFCGIEKAYSRLDEILEKSALGYVVVNNNITRDIEVPVGETICEIFSNLGYQFAVIDESEIFHLGNLRRQAKRINSRHIRQIVKVWKK